MTTAFEIHEPKRAEVDALSGATLLEFGSPTCGWCNAAKPMIESALGDHVGVRHVKIADGSGRPLGRSFRVKLWPTLVFLRDGQEVSRLVRPSDGSAVQAALREIEITPP